MDSKPICQGHQTLSAVLGRLRVTVLHASSYGKQTVKLPPRPFRTWQMGHWLPASCTSSALGTLPQAPRRATCFRANAASPARSTVCCALTSRYAPAMGDMGEGWVGVGWESVGQAGDGTSRQPDVRRESRAVSRQRSSRAGHPHPPRHDASWHAQYTPERPVRSRAPTGALLKKEYHRGAGGSRR